MTDLEFRDAFRNNKDVLYRYVYRMTGSAGAADDMVQDVFLILWRRPWKYDPNRGELRSYLLGVARNLLLKRWRKERAREETALDSELLVCAPVDLTCRERSDIVAKAVQALPPLQREALVLAEYEEMTLREIADLTGVELAAVKSRLHRARETLRRILAPLLESKGMLYGTGR